MLVAIEIECRSIEALGDDVERRGLQDAGRRARTRTVFRDRRLSCAPRPVGERAAQARDVVAIITPERHTGRLSMLLASRSRGCSALRCR